MNALERELYNRLLVEQEVRFRFKKESGEIRDARGTCNLKYIPVSKHPATRMPITTSIRYYDYDRQDWRSFRLGSLILIHGGVKVHNINGTSNNTCKCGSWKAHWEKYNEKGQSWPTYCVATGCCNKATVGAHVQKENSSSAKWYIIPFCDHHNGPEFHGESIDVGADTSFASANRGETCGY